MSGERGRTSSSVGRGHVSMCDPPGPSVPNPTRWPTRRCGNVVPPGGRRTPGRGHDRGRLRAPGAELLAVVPVVTRLHGHRQADPLPDGDAGRLHDGGSRFADRLDGPARRRGRRPSPSGPEIDDGIGCRRVPAAPGGVRHRGHDVGARLPPGARRPGGAGAGRAGRPRARPGQVPDVRTRADGGPERRLRRGVGPAGIRGARPRPALLRRAPRLEPRRPLRL